MKTFDFRSWQKFRVGDFFEGERGTSRKMQTLEEGKIPIIAAARYNQGIAGYYNVDAEFENEITVSCNGAGCGSTYFHDYPFAITGDAVVLKKKKEISREALFFIATVYDEFFRKKYSYADKCSAEKIENEFIPLPSKENFPDWEYMKEYIQVKFESAENKLGLLKKNDLTKRKLRTENWKEFEMLKLGFKNYHGVRLTKYKREDGEIPLLTAGKENQGVAAYISNAFATFEDAITIDMFGNSFFHKGIYTGDDNVYFFVNNKLSDYSKIFIASVLNAENSKKYAYKEQFRQPQADSLKVMLPADENEKPDWQYVENYMRKVIKKNEEKIRKIKTGILG